MQTNITCSYLTILDHVVPIARQILPQATPAASPLIQSIMSGIEELITKHLPQLSSSTLQSQPCSSKDPNYSNQKMVAIHFGSEHLLPADLILSHAGLSSNLAG